MPKLLATLLLLPAAALACLWDHDTLRYEARGLPGSLIPLSILFVLFKLPLGHRLIGSEPLSPVLWVLRVPPWPVSPRLRPRLCAQPAPSVHARQEL
jgi:hypothetical protein